MNAPLETNAAYPMILEYPRFTSPNEPVKLVCYGPKHLICFKPDRLARINQVMKVFRQLHPANQYDFLTKLPGGNFRCVVDVPPASSDEDTDAFAEAIRVIFKRFFGIEVVLSRNDESSPQGRLALEEATA